MSILEKFLIDSANQISSMLDINSYGLNHQMEIISFLHLYNVISFDGQMTVTNNHFFIGAEVELKFSKLATISHSLEMLENEDISIWNESTAETLIEMYNYD